MKRIGYIYEKIIERQNLMDATLALSKTKKSKRSREILKKNAVQIVDELLQNPHPDGKYKTFKHREGQKVRQIFEPSLRDQILAKAIVNVLIPIIRKKEYFHSYAAMKGKGPLLARNAVERYVRKKGARWFCKLDIVHCFPSFPLHLVLETYDHLFKDKKARDLIIEDMKSYTNFIGTENGLALGQNTSQEWSNLVLTYACYKAKQEIGVLGLVEYLDDFVLIGKSKKELTAKRDAFKALLRSWGFQLHDERDAVRPIQYIDKKGRKRGEAIDFCGYRIYRGFSTIRRFLYKKIRRCILRMKSKEPNATRAKRFLSYLGSLIHSASSKVMTLYGVTEEFIQMAKQIMKGEIKPCSC